MIWILSRWQKSFACFFFNERHDRGGKKIKLGTGMEYSTMNNSSLQFIMPGSFLGAGEE